MCAVPVCCDVHSDEVYASVPCVTGCTQVCACVHPGQCLGMLTGHENELYTDVPCVCDGVYTGVLWCTRRPVSGYIDGSRRRGAGRRF